MKTQAFSAIKLAMKDLLSKKFGPGLVHYMATTGKYTDECMDIGCLPVLAHFYQPIPDLKELEQRKIWDKVSPLSGIAWKPDEYLKNLRELAEFADECEWTHEPTDDPLQLTFHRYSNGSFSYGCAAICHSIIRKYKPRRVIEVGSGISSRVIASAILANNGGTSSAPPHEHFVKYTIIDPYSALDITKYPKGTELLLKKVETVDVSLFQELQAGDVLFIDSSHVSKIGSDVNFEMLEVLPLLNKGVIVHFHDISLPFEYSKVYATTPEFRMFWTEAYLLQAYLAHNTKYEIILPCAFVQRTFEQEFRALYPKGNIVPENSVANWHSGSFWIKCVM